MKHAKELCAAVLCFFLAFACAAAAQRPENEQLAERISPHLLRFHVLANSNSAGDQKLKLEVKGLLLEKLAKILEEETENNGGESSTNRGNADKTPKICDRNTASDSRKEKICRYVSAHRRELEALTTDYISAQGRSYGASVRLARCYFPTKYYGDIVLPCGTYDAVQVTLGDGRGRNWWCLLYPRLCFIDATHAVVPEESKEELACLVGEDDYAALLSQDGARIHIRFKLFDLLSGLLSPEEHVSAAESGG